MQTEHSATHFPVTACAGAVCVGTPRHTHIVSDTCSVVRCFLARRKRHRRGQVPTEFQRCARGPHGLFRDFDDRRISSSFVHINSSSFESGGCDGAVGRAVHGPTLHVRPMLAHCLHLATAVRTKRISACVKPANFASFFVVSYVSCGAVTRAQDH